MEHFLFVNLSPGDKVCLGTTNRQHFAIFNRSLAATVYYKAVPCNVDVTVRKMVWNSLSLTHPTFRRLTHLLTYGTAILSSIPWGSLIHLEIIIWGIRPRLPIILPGNLNTCIIHNNFAGNTFILPPSLQKLVVYGNGILHDLDAHENLTSIQFLIDDYGFENNFEFMKYVEIPMYYDNHKQPEYEYKLPPNLTELRSPTTSIKNLEFPKGLTKLTLSPVDTMQCIPEFPPNLTELECRDPSHYLFGCLPDTLQVLKLGNILNIPSKLPKMLRHLDIVTPGIYAIRTPCSTVTHLKLRACQLPKFDFGTIGDLFPNLKVLHLQSNTSVSLHTLQLLESVTEVKLRSKKLVLTDLDLSRHTKLRRFRLSSDFVFGCANVKFPKNIRSIRIRVRKNNILARPRFRADLPSGLRFLEIPNFDGFELTMDGQRVMSSLNT